MHVKAPQWLRGWSRQDERLRKNVVMTLSDEARAALAELAPRGGRSKFVERLILEAQRQKAQRGATPL